MPVTIDNQLPDKALREGLFLALDRMIMVEDGKRKLHRTMSTSRVYLASDKLSHMLPDDVWSNRQRVNIGPHLQPEIFELLMQQSIENPDQIDMEAAIGQMVDAPEIKIAH
jgi:hypothetical protein